jgi:hypothetical protein
MHIRANGYNSPFHILWQKPAHSKDNMRIHNMATGLQDENKIATYIYMATTIDNK